MEKPIKLTWTQKRIIKHLIKKAQKLIKKHQKKATRNHTDRTREEKALLELTEIFEVEHNEQIINEQNIKNIPEKELQEMLEQTLELLKKEI